MNKDKNPIIRRQVVKDIEDGKFSSITLMHMAHYDSAANHIVSESKRLGRPIVVASIGCGDMWELRILVHGMQISKAEILKEYVAVDYEHRDSLFGDKLSQLIKFKSIAKDLNLDPTIPISDNHVDIVICTEFIEHVEEESGNAILAEIYRILKPNGAFYITTPNADNSSRSDKYHLHELGLNELLTKLESCGLMYEYLFGTYIDRKMFKIAQQQLHRLPDEMVEDMSIRFSSNFYRVILATAYPEYSNGVAVFGRKK